MIQLPTILEEFNTIMTAKGTSKDTNRRRSRFFQQCKCFYDEGKSWHRSLEAGIGTHLFNSIKNGIPPVFPVKYFSLAYTVSLYWAFQILLQATFRRAMQEIPMSDSVISPIDIYTW